MPGGYPGGSPGGPPGMGPGTRPPGIVTLKAPRNVTAAVDGSTIVLTWTAASSVDGYNAYQSIDGGTWTKLNATTVEALTHTLTPTDPGEYNFYTTSVRGDKESSPSAETTTTEAMMVQVYTDTLSPRISAVDGTAFVDNTAAITTYADGNHLLEVQDSAGNVISGVLKAQGSGETLGSELVPQPLFDSPAQYTSVFSGWTVGSGVASYDGELASASLQKTGITQAFALYLRTLEVLSLTSGRFIGPYTGNAPSDGNRITTGIFTARATIPDVSPDRLVFFAGAFSEVNCVGSIGGATSLKQVTAPSTSGCTLVDEINGTTQNLFTAPAGFKYNEPSYTCTIKQILPTA